ncbi:MAG: dihydropteroate synthase, partial [Pseudomonadota bacterium]
MTYYRAIARTDHTRPDTSLSLAGTWCWFDTVECLFRDRPSETVMNAQHLYALRQTRQSHSDGPGRAV